MIFIGADGSGNAGYVAHVGDRKGEGHAAGLLAGEAEAHGCDDLNLRSWSRQTVQTVVKEKDMGLLGRFSPAFDIDPRIFAGGSTAFYVGVNAVQARQKKPNVVQQLWDKSQRLSNFV